MFGNDAPVPDLAAVPHYCAHRVLWWPSVFFNHSFHFLNRLRPPPSHRIPLIAAQSAPPPTHNCKRQELRSTNRSAHAPEAVKQINEAVVCVRLYLVRPQPRRAYGAGADGAQPLLSGPPAGACLFPGRASGLPRGLGRAFGRRSSPLWRCVSLWASRALRRAAALCVAGAARAGGGPATDEAGEGAQAVHVFKAFVVAFGNGVEAVARSEEGAADGP